MNKLYYFYRLGFLLTAILEPLIPSLSRITRVAGKGAEAEATTNRTSGNI